MDFKLTSLALVLGLLLLRGPPATATEEDEDTSSSEGYLVSANYAILKQWVALFRGLFEIRMDEASAEKVENYLRRMLQLEGTMKNTDQAPHYERRWRKLGLTKHLEPSVDPSNTTKFLLDNMDEKQGCEWKNFERAHDLVHRLGRYPNLHSYINANMDNLRESCRRRLAAQSVNEEKRIPIKLSSDNDGVERVYSHVDHQVGWPSQSQARGSSLENRRFMSRPRPIDVWTVSVVLSLMQDSGVVSAEEPEPIDKSTFAHEYDKQVRDPCRRVYGRTSNNQEPVKVLLYFVPQNQEGDETTGSIKLSKFCEQIMMNPEVLSRSFNTWQRQVEQYEREEPSSTETHPRASRRTFMD